LLALFMVGACTTAPPRPNPSVVEREIVKSILGEVCASVLNVQGYYARTGSGTGIPHFSPNEGWIVTIETSLSTAIEGSASPTASLNGPIIPGLLVPKGGTSGSFGVGGLATFDQTATALRDDKRYVVLDTLMNDPTLCPSRNTEFYAAYWNGAEFDNHGKYLSGTLGIRDWLLNGAKAQDFEPVAQPTTTVAEGSLKGDNPLGVQMFLKDVEANKAFVESCTHGPSCLRVNGNMADWYLTQGQPIVERLEQNPFQVSDNSLLNYKFEALDANGGSVTWPTWLKMPSTSGPGGQAFHFQGAAPVPNTQNNFQIKITATTKTGDTASKSFWVYVNPAPKQTSFGPTYSATFTFLIKATGQLSPAITLDKVKAGTGTLFSVIRTETNFVNIVFYSTGVPLVEVDRFGNVVGTGQPLRVGNVDTINNAIQRIDDTLLRLNLSRINSGNQ
jgi:hypothetical protein